MQTKLSSNLRTATSAPKWQRPRISLRAAILVLTLSCLWFGWQSSSAERQRRAVNWLRTRGCSIAYDYGLNAKVEKDSFSITSWLTTVLGQDFFYRVVGVRFEQPLVIDDDVFHVLKDFSGLRHLEGRRLMLAPGIERRFADLSCLEELELEECSLNDVQLAALGRLINLRVLNLQHNPFHGTGLTAWDKLDKLEILYLSDTAVADENLRHLTRLKNLRSLYLGDTGLGDTGMDFVSKIFSLQHLDIDDLYDHRRSRFTNQGVAQLTALQNLQRLDVGEFPLTAENRDALQSLPRFQTLWVTRH